MAGGLPIVQASSEAWPEYGAQEARALNTGWILDQRFDGAGGFITNCTPTSSGFTFISTGDATGFYVIGRALRIIQADPRTTVCTVGQSSFSAGNTRVYISQFSVASGLSTVASTQAITSVAATYAYPQSTGNNTFPITVTPSTASQPQVSIGFNPAVTHFGIPNQYYLWGRNTAGGGDVHLIGVNSLDHADIGQSGVTDIRNQLAIGLSLGTPASSGFLRLVASGIAIVGKTSTGGDDIIWPQQFASTTLTADVISSGQNGTVVFSKTLSVGTWHITAGIQVASTSVTTDVIVQLNDGTNTFASASAPMTGGSTVTPGVFLPLSAVVSHTTALAYRVSLFANSTTARAKAETNCPTISSTAASWFTAVKIGSSGV